MTRDGVALHHELTAGDPGLPPVVLTHGWCCDHSYFAPQLEHLAGLGYTVVAPDLRGHGSSDAPEGDHPGADYSMPALADDVAWLCGELGLSRPVLVGHSMGGVVAFELVIRHPELAAAVVMIDSPVARPDASRAGMPAFLEQLRGPGWREAIAEYVGGVLFLPTDDPERRESVIARMTSAPQHVAIGAFEGMRDFDPDAGAGISIPSLYIAADDRPLSDMPHLFRLAPGMQFGQTVGSGHFCTLEVPDQINAMLARFLGLLDLGPRRT